MNLSEVAYLVGFAGIYDLRIQVDELKVRAWAESLDDDMPLEEGKKIISAHYANSESAVNPSHLNREWRHRKASERERERSRKISLELERAEKEKAPPEVVAIYMAEIRKALKKGTDAQVEKDSGEVASDL